MDGYDLFRKLSAGAKFDFKRFRSDAEKLQIIRPKQNVQEKKSPDEAKNKKTVQVKAKVNEEAKEDESDSDDSESDSRNVMKEQGAVLSDIDGEMDDEEDDDDDDDDDNKSHNDDDDDDKVHNDAVDDDGDDDDDKEENSNDSDNDLKILRDVKYIEAEYKSRGKEERRKKPKRKKTERQEAELKWQEINRLRKKYRLKTYGTDIPDPIDSFGDLETKYKVSNNIIRNIEAAGYKTPTPIQIQAIPVMLENRDILACAPTGSGKTAAFILPILHHLKEPRNEGVRALVLAPTRELAKQTYREFQRLSDKMGFRLAYIDKVGKNFERLKKIFKKSDIMVSTPNRLVYLLEQSPPLVSLTSVKWLVVDESDKLFEDGKTGFRDQLAKIYKSCDGSVRRAMFSATFTYDVEQWCKLNLDNVVQVYVGEKNTATSTVEQKLLFCGSEYGKLLAIRSIVKEGIEPPVLVFVQSKERAKELFHELIYDGMNVDVIHADRTQTQRDNVVKCFRSGKIWILICTELMGRGIDFKGVNLVINYDFPNSTISYIHRIGRTGRAGRPGKAITFFTENDTVFLRRDLLTLDHAIPTVNNSGKEAFLKTLWEKEKKTGVMKSSGCPVPDYMLKMNKPKNQTRKKLAKYSISRDTISTDPRRRVWQRVKSMKKDKQPDDLQKRISSWLPADQKRKLKKKRENESGTDMDSSAPKKQKIDSDNLKGTKSHKKAKSHKQFKKRTSFKDKKSEKGHIKGNIDK